MCRSQRCRTLIIIVPLLILVFVFILVLGDMGEKKDEERAGYAGENTDREDDERAAVKPVFLKGLFRCVHI